MKIRIFITLFFLLIFSITIIYIYSYYPKQLMPIGKIVHVTTPDSLIYHNDCLHPCIRFDSINNSYHMVQSPWYQGNDLIENPIYYISKDYKNWDNGTIIHSTPKKGYNSDPNIFVKSNGKLICIWREVSTPFCDSINKFTAVRGGELVDNQVVIKKHLFSNNTNIISYDLSPCIISKDDTLLIYATWYQSLPSQKNKGIVIYKDTSILKDEFYISDTIEVKSVLTVDKWKQFIFDDKMYFIPFPKKHDIWHFDLFEYNDNLYMVSVGKMDDNIMLSKSEDWKNFVTYKIPLVNNHFTESIVGERYYFYKPTAFIKNDSLFLFYTGNTMRSKEEWRNKLFYTTMNFKELLENIK